MLRIKFRGLLATMFAVFLFLSLTTSSVNAQISQRTFIPRYLLRLYDKISTGQYELPPGVTEVHSFLANVEKCHNTNTIKKRKPNVVKLFSAFSGIHSSKEIVSATIHLHITSRAKAAVGATHTVCKLGIFDNKTGVRVSSVKIPCHRPSVRVIKLTNLVKSWLEFPRTNSGLRVKISSRTSSKVTRVPYISTTSRLRKPFFILFTKK